MLTMLAYFGLGLLAGLGLMIGWVGDLRRAAAFWLRMYQRAEADRLETQRLLWRDRGPYR